LNQALLGGLAEGFERLQTGVIDLGKDLLGNVKISPLQAAVRGGTAPGICRPDLERHIDIHAAFGLQHDVFSVVHQHQEIWGVVGQPACMGLVIDPYRLGAGIFVESDDIRGAVQELGHLLLEGIGAGHQVEGGFGGLDGWMALGVVGLERFPGDNGLALAEGSLL
jgi:hypothetical protein